MMWIHYRLHHLIAMHHYFLLRRRRRPRHQPSWRELALVRAHEGKLNDAIAALGRLVELAKTAEERREAKKATTFVLPTNPSPILAASRRSA